MQHFNPLSNEHTVLDAVKAILGDPLNVRVRDLRHSRRAKRALNGYDRGWAVWLPARVTGATGEARSGRLRLRQADAALSWAPGRLARFRRRTVLSAQPGSPTLSADGETISWLAALDTEPVSLALPKDLGLAFVGHLTQVG